MRTGSIASSRRTSGPTATGEAAEAPNYAIVGVGDGTEAVLHATVRGVDRPLATFLGVPESEVSTLAVAAGYVAASVPGGDRLPVGLRAVARDGSGNAVLGVPVKWENPENVLVVPDADPLPGPDYASFNDVCVPPSERVGARTSRVDASFGDLTAGLDLTWNGGTDASTDEGFAPDLRCDGAGCGCATTGTPSGAVLVVLALAFARRRAARIG